MTRRYTTIFGLVLGMVPAMAMIGGQAVAQERARRPATSQALPVPQSGSVVEMTRPAGAGADHSGRTRDGRAATMQAGRGGRLDDGGRFDPAASVASSRVLPLGTTARVTNLDNGRVTMVQVRDRGPRGGDGRLLDVSPAAARMLGLGEGTAPVRVAPLAVPQPDGSVRLGEGTGMPGRPAAPALSERPRDWG